MTLPYSGPRPWLAGHRGVAGEALENTLQSFALAVEQGADLVELDVQLTADGGLVVLHDPSLERLAARPEVVEATDSATLRGVRLRDGSRLPTLVEVFAALPPGLPVNVELKRWRADREHLAAATLATLAVAPARPVVVSSFDGELLVTLRRLDSRVALATLTSDDAAAAVRLAGDLDAVSVHLGLDLASASGLDTVLAAGLPALVYTVNDPATARQLVARGASGLFTDFPGRMRAALASPPGSASGAADYASLPRFGGRSDGPAPER